MRFIIISPICILVFYALKRAINNGLSGLKNQLPGPVFTSAIQTCPGHALFHPDNPLLFARFNAQNTNVELLEGNNGGGIIITPGK